MSLTPTTATVAALITIARASKEHVPPAGWPTTPLNEAMREVLASATSSVHSDYVHVSWTQWASVRATKGTSKAGAWLDLIATLEGYRNTEVASKQACPGWAPVELDDGKRADGSVRRITALCLDCDDQGDWHKLLDTLAELGLAYYAHRSPSHVAEAPKWRVVLPLAAHIVGDDLAQWRALYTAARVVFGAVGRAWFDPSTLNESRLWYVPAHLPGMDEREQYELSGHALDIWALASGLDAVASAPVRPAAPTLTVVPRERSTEMSALERAHRWIARRDPAIEGSNGDHWTFVTCAKMVNDFALSDAEALEVMSLWNAGNSPPWTEAALAKKLAHARKYGTHSSGEALTASRPATSLPRSYGGAAVHVVPPVEPDDSIEPDEQQVIDDARANGPSGIRWVDVYQSGKREGLPKLTQANIRLMLAHHGVIARFNLMAHRDEVIIPGGLAECRNNVTLAQVRMWARGYGLSAGDALADILQVIVSSTPWHPVAEWVRSRRWDGVDRFEALFASLTLAPEYAARHEAQARAMLRAWLVTAVRACFVGPDTLRGVTSQGILVLQGPQGVRKTRWLKALMPHSLEAFGEGFILDPSQRDSVQKATGYWLVELGELDATLRKADIAALKALVTSPSDTFRAAYARREETLPRRTVFAASVNEGGYIHDLTGGRRFWSVEVSGCNPEHGIDMQQLWAQMWQVAEEEPDGGYLPAEVEAAVIGLNARFAAVDPIAESLNERWEVDETKTCWESLAGICKGIDDRAWATSDKRSLARALREKLKAPQRAVKGILQWSVVRRVG